MKQVIVKIDFSDEADDDHISRIANEVGGCFFIPYNKDGPDRNTPILTHLYVGTQFEVVGPATEREGE